MDSVSFDSIAPVYDATRVFDGVSFNAALDYIVGRFPPEKYPKLFEPGIGTGRIAIPLAEKGYHVTGADISTEMLKMLADKLALKNPPLPVDFIQKDITALPFPDASFDIAVAVHIFHLIPEWKKAMNEVLRILKPDAPLIIMFTSSNTEIPAIKQRYQDLCAEYGHPVKHPGMQSDTDLPGYIAAIGRRLEEIPDRWEWQVKVRIDKAFSEINAKYYSISKRVPDKIHQKAIQKLESELKQQHGDLAVEVAVSNRIKMILVLPS